MLTEDELEGWDFWPDFCHRIVSLEQNPRQWVKTSCVTNKNTLFEHRSYSAALSIPLWNALMETYSLPHRSSPTSAPLAATMGPGVKPKESSAAFTQGTSRKYVLST